MDIWPTFGLNVKKIFAYFILNNSSWWEQNGIQFWLDLLVWNPNVIRRPPPPPSFTVWNLVRRKVFFSWSGKDTNIPQRIKSHSLLVSLVGSAAKYLSSSDINHSDLCLFCHCMTKANLLWDEALWPPYPPACLTFLRPLDKTDGQFYLPLVCLERDKNKAEPEPWLRVCSLTWVTSQRADSQNLKSMTRIKHFLEMKQSSDLTAAWAIKRSVAWKALHEKASESVKMCTPSL